jgi:hypothetical protein
MNRRAFLGLLGAAGASLAALAHAPAAQAFTPAPLEPPRDLGPDAPEPAVSHGDEAKVEEARWVWRRPRRRRYVWRRRRWAWRRRRPWAWRRRRVWRRRRWR